MRKTLIGFILGILLLIFFLASQKSKNDLPLIAIANYGSHSSLEDSIQGIKQALETQGFFENKNIRIEITDVNFDASRIPQMISHLKSHHPKVMIVNTTPIAQYAKGHIKDIPLVFNVITDPIEAALLKDKQHPDQNMTGSSDQQDLVLLLKFAKLLKPQMKTIGLLYATAEINDTALLKMMQESAEKLGIQVVARPVHDSRDIVIQTTNLANSVDFMYVGASGPVQSSLPAIAAICKNKSVPILNLNQSAVQEGLALGSFGVDYEAVGRNAGSIVAAILKGKEVASIPPIYPQKHEHHGYLNKKLALELGLTIPESEYPITIVE